MEVRSDLQNDKVPSQVVPRTRLRVWFFRVCSSILVYTCLVQLITVGELWRPQFLAPFSTFKQLSVPVENTAPSPPTYPPARNYTNNGYLMIYCNGGLNQMRSEICDMVTVARLLNLTLVVPELDKTSFWADPSNFEDVFDLRHFIGSLRDEVRIIRRVPKRFGKKHGLEPLEMPPISWSSEKYYLEQVLPLFNKHQVVRFNKTDARLANNGLPPELQRLRCRVNFQALKFAPQIEALGEKLIHILQQKGPFVALHLRYEMDMLSFSGCTHGCTDEEAEHLKQLRYDFPWWREKEIISEERRSQGMCPLTPEEASLVLQALGFGKDTQIYIAAGEIYGDERRLATLRTAFPKTLKKEKLLDPEELQPIQKYLSQMAALDFMVSVASNVFIPTYDGNMARVVEGHRRYLGFKKTIQLDRRNLVPLLNMYENKTLSWDEFSREVQILHEKRTGQPIQRRVIADKPKEEDYFYSNPQECLCDGAGCDDSSSTGSST